MAGNNPAGEMIEDLLATRWSPRAFDSGKRVDQTSLARLFEAARWAPSCFNEQPWRYLLFDRFQSEQEWNMALSCLVEGNQTWAANAPILLVAIADTAFSKNGKPNRWCDYDTGAASENLCLQATALGLGAHQMGGFDASAVSATFHVPERYKPIAMIAIGHAESEQPTTERSRRSLGDFVFFNEWDKSLTDTG